jgi:hypothetical protein
VFAAAWRFCCHSPCDLYQDLFLQRFHGRRHLVHLLGFCTAQGFVGMVRPRQQPSQVGSFGFCTCTPTTSHQFADEHHVCCVEWLGRFLDDARSTTPDPEVWIPPYRRQSRKIPGSSSLTATSAWGATDIAPVGPSKRHSSCRPYLLPHTWFINRLTIAAIINIPSPHTPRGASITTCCGCRIQVLR